MTEQDQPDQLLTAQLTGQPDSVHVLVSMRGGHAAPPLTAVAVTVRVRVCVPEPHVTEQVDVHDETLQSRAHTASAVTVHAVAT